MNSKKAVEVFIPYILYVPSMGIWYLRYQIIPEGAAEGQVPYRQVGVACLQAARVVGDPTSEGSRTAKSGTDGEERHIEAGKRG